MPAASVSFGRAARRGSVSTQRTPRETSNPRGRSRGRPDRRPGSLQPPAAALRAGLVLRSLNWLHEMGLRFLCVWKESTPQAALEPSSPRPRARRSRRGDASSLVGSPSRLEALAGRGSRRRSSDAERGGSRCLDDQPRVLPSRPPHRRLVASTHGLQGALVQRRPCPWVPQCGRGKPGRAPTEWTPGPETQPGKKSVTKYTVQRLPS